MSCHICGKADSRTKLYSSKSAFTIIELVFVIVIIGVLASVAIVKLNATQKSARAEVVESFVGTINRSTFPSIYTKAIRNDGSVDTFRISDYLKVPESITLLSDTLNKTICKPNDFGIFATTELGVTIYCRDGNKTHPPILSFSPTDVNVTLDSSYFN